MDLHSIIPPSSASIWSRCPGWVLMSQTFLQEGRSEAALEGEAVHEFAEAMIKHRCQNSNRPHFEDYRGRVSQNGIACTQDMFDGALMYAEVVIAEMEKANVFGGDHLGVEKHLEKIPSIHELSFGTVDSYVYDKKRKHLFVGDLKFGRLVVEARNNEQLLNYFAGILDNVMTIREDEPEATVTFCIVQPRAYHPEGPIRRAPTVRMSDLRADINRLASSAREALKAGAKTKTSTKCRYCTAKTHCEAALKGAGTLFEATGGAMPFDASLAELSALYTNVCRAKEHLTYMETALEEQLLSSLRGGKRVPGYVAETVTGRQKWSRPEEEIKTLGAALGLNLTKETLVTPAQAKKAGLADELIQEYASRPNKLTLKQEDTTLAKEIFSN